MRRKIIEIPVIKILFTNHNFEVAKMLFSTSNHYCYWDNMIRNLLNFKLFIAHKRSIILTPTECRSIKKWCETNNNYESKEELKMKKKILKSIPSLESLKDCLVEL